MSPGSSDLVDLLCLAQEHCPTRHRPNASGFPLQPPQPAAVWGMSTRQEKGSSRISIFGDFVLSTQHRITSLNERQFGVAETCWFWNHSEEFQTLAPSRTLWPRTSYFNYLILYVLRVNRGKKKFYLRHKHTIGTKVVVLKTKSPGTIMALLLIRVLPTPHQ